jgi:O-antigen/teichoic acid export membrane protein
VGFYLGLESVAVYHIIRRISGAFSQLGSPLYHVLYPKMISDVSKDSMSAKDDNYQRLTLLILAIGSLILVLFYLTRNYWLGYLFSGAMITDGVTLLLFLQMFVQLISMSFIYVHPLLLARGGIKYHFYTTLLSNIAYILLIMVLGPLGILGFIIAYGLQNASNIAQKLYQIKRHALN